MYAHTDHEYSPLIQFYKMAKKKSYENDEAFRNFRLEDFLPSMNRREQEEKASESERGQAMSVADLFPPSDAPNILPAQTAVSDATTPSGQTVQGTTDDDGADESATEADVSAERTVVRRISGKQRRVSLDEYSDTYLRVPKITNRKPVFVSGEVRDELDMIARRLGGRGMSASGLVENLVRLHLEAYREDIRQWRRL